MLAWLSVWTRCKRLAYGSADATVTPSSLLQQNPEWFILLVPAYPGCPAKNRLCVYDYNVTSVSFDRLFVAEYVYMLVMFCCLVWYMLDLCTFLGDNTIYCQTF